MFSNKVIDIKLRDFVVFNGEGIEPVGDFNELDALMTIDGLKFELRDGEIYKSLNKENFTIIFQDEGQTEKGVYMGMYSLEKCKCSEDYMGEVSVLKGHTLNFKFKPLKEV